MIEEDAAEVIAVGKHLRLKRKKRAARIDQVHARKTILQSDILRAQMLFHRDREIGTSLYRRIVGDDHHLASRDPADAGQEARRRRLVVVQAERRERRELEKRRPSIEEPGDAIAHRQLTLFAVTIEVLGAAALARAAQTLAELGNELLHPSAVAGERGIGRIEVSVKRDHPTTSPSAAVGLEPAARAAPDGVHAVHFSAAPLA